MDTEFIELVRVMRTAQKKYFKAAVNLDNPNRGAEMRRLLPVCKSAEEAVDKWIALYDLNLTKFQAWKNGEAKQADDSYRTMKTDEMPGFYNASHDEEAEEKNGA